VLGQPLVHEREVCAVEIQQAAVVLDQAVEEHHGFVAHGLREVLIEVRVEVRIRVDLVHIL
jgi:hypothetical protein